MHCFLLQAKIEHSWCRAQEIKIPCFSLAYLTCDVLIVLFFFSLFFFPTVNIIRLVCYLCTKDQCSIQAFKIVFSVINVISILVTPPQLLVCV